MDEYNKTASEALAAHIAEYNRSRLATEREMSDRIASVDKQLSTLRAEVKIYAAIASAIGTILGGALARYVLPGH